MSDSAVVISVRNLVVRFPTRGGVLTILNGVNFDVLRGETLVIMGGSGSGKSTLLNCLIGEIHPDEGELIYRLPSVGEVDLHRAEPRTADQVRKRFGILFQSGALFSSLTVAENVALPLKEHSQVNKAVIDIVVALKLQQVHMLAHRNKYPAQLSGGQKKRVGLARATALDPEILFYDEPSAGLDPVTSTAIDSLMMDLSKKLNVTTVVVTHEMDSAFRIADRMVMLDQGRVLRIGPRSEFERLRDAKPESLASDADRLIHQFLNGAPSGPLTDAQGLSLYEKILDGESLATTRAG
ncbi:MAG: ATP-binding cassette domain-containing protein [Phycisphaerae bacterium]|nr:ATP-binding cassette domain-containing protein [Phycisphaerae bacterium]MCZ2398656.1 ATP-binding cassette domain-containing protein [Phycisphaerae bacterium]NUQ48460.1 ATP-binding cassette domain-containing protein [Phycisphaerae bacterium]